MIFTSLLTKMLRIAMRVTCRIISEWISGAKMKVKLIHFLFQSHSNDNEWVFIVKLIKIVFVRNIHSKCQT